VQTTEDANQKQKQGEHAKFGHRTTNHMLLTLLTFQILKEQLVIMPIVGIQMATLMGYGVTQLIPTEVGMNVIKSDTEHFN